MGSFNQIRMQIKHLFYLLPFCFAKPQTSGDDGTSAIDAITDFASLFGGLQGDATSTMITEGLKFVSMELLPAIEAMQQPDLTTGERIARASYSYAQNVEGKEAPEAGTVP